MVYTALESFIPEDIHALSIEALGPDDTADRV
jgi:acid stress-induced BolA-like protein IbaG/YrbA